MTKIFVFGSNEAGIHGAGAAKFAYEKRGARWGKCYGHHGDSFAIPTKDENIADALPLDRIKQYVEGFIAYAKGHRKMTFQVTCIGCGLAGLKHEDIAPMFVNAPSNCQFDTAWDEWLGDRIGSDGKPLQFWGTF